MNNNYIKEQAKGFQSLTFIGLAKSILKDKRIYLSNTSDEIILKKVIKILENDAEFLGKSSLKYWQLLVEELEETTADERRLIQLLSENYGDFMLNVDAEELKKPEDLREYFESFQDLNIVKI